jgi:hypothetical protein
VLHEIYGISHGCLFTKVGMGLGVGVRQDVDASLDVCATGICARSEAMTRHAKGVAQLLAIFLDISYLGPNECGDLEVPFVMQLVSGSESPRIWWRLQLLREWSYEQVEQIFC